MFKPYSNYHKGLKNEIEKIAKNPKAIFIGQQVQSESFYGLLDNIALDKRTEMPVVEELQLGMSIGLAMEGYLPFSIYQRMDFLPRAADQLINHLNLIKIHSKGLYNPKIILFTTIGLKNTGLQHSKNLIKGLRILCNNIKIYDLNTTLGIKEVFKTIIKSKNSSIIVARQNLFYKN